MNRVGLILCGLAVLAAVPCRADEAKMRFEGTPIILDKHGKEVAPGLAQLVDKVKFGQVSPEDIDRIAGFVKMGEYNTESYAREALTSNALFRMPNFQVDIEPRLLLLVNRYSHDPDVETRYFAGRLSRRVQDWENFESPAAKTNHRRVTLERAGGARSLVERFHRAVVALCFLLPLPFALSVARKTLRERKWARQAAQAAGELPPILSDNDK
ncbi:MAG: hypothetical protein NTX64_09300 [Elusimicrobia bacterium]|nr:hypothetical protein [Elusimicrobiota bacterium]